MLKMKLWYFGHLVWRADSLEKTLMLGKTRGGGVWLQRMRRLDGISHSADMSLSKFRERVKDREAWHAGVHRVGKNWTCLRDWTTIVCGESGPRVWGCLVFMGWVILYANKKRNICYANYFVMLIVMLTSLKKWQESPRTGPPPTLWPFMISLGTVMAPVGESFSKC